jgi:hypothetical protein
MPRVTSRASGLVVVKAPVPECGAPFSDNVDCGLFELTQEVHQHLVDVGERIRTMATPTIEQSIHKRVLLYLVALLNDSMGTLVLLASHNGLRMTLPMNRFSYEYVARAIYYAQRKKLAFGHIRGLWPHLNRLFSGGVEADMSPEVREEIDKSLASFEAAHPEWQRPHDGSLLPILIEMHGEKRGQRLYERWHMFQSPFVHGTFDGVGLVLGYDGNNTIVRPGAPIANTALAEATRFAFTMTALMKREFNIVDYNTRRLFRLYVENLNRLRLRVVSPFPLPSKKFREKG